METKKPSTGAAGTSGEGAAAGEQPVASQSTGIAPLPHDTGRTSGSDAGAGHSGPQRPGTPPYTILLACGIASSVLYIAADITGAIRYAGYSYADHTFSELLAVGSPVRSFMVALCSVTYSMLMAAFVAGVWNSPGPKRTPRITAALLAGYAGIGMVTGIVFPMNTRIALAAGEAGLRNAMHPVGTAVMSLFLLLAMGFAGGLLGRRFRLYTYATIIVLLVFGILTSLQAADMTHNRPTPWMGIEERINIYATMLWIAVLAAGLWRAGEQGAPGGRPAGLPAPDASREGHAFKGSWGMS